jgi:hypothetical protein
MHADECCNIQISNPTNKARVTVSQYLTLSNMSAETDASTTSEEHHHHQPTQPHLSKQDATTVDPTKLTALTPEVVCVCVFCRIVDMIGLCSSSERIVGI